MLRDVLTSRCAARAKAPGCFLVPGRFPLKLTAKSVPRRSHGDPLEVVGNTGGTQGFQPDIPYEWNGVRYCVNFDDDDFYAEGCLSRSKVARSDLVDRFSRLGKIVYSNQPDPGSKGNPQEGCSNNRCLNMFQGGQM